VEHHNFRLKKAEHGKDAAEHHCPIT